MSKTAREQTTTTRSSYVQASWYHTGRVRGGSYMMVSLRQLRDLIAATADYDENSTVRLESTSVKVTETRQSNWRALGRGED